MYFLRGKRISNFNHPIVEIAIVAETGIHITELVIVNNKKILKDTC